jgi:hypothetical protein
MNILKWDEIGSCNDLCQIILSHIAEIHNTPYQLSKGILEEENDLYILTGRDRGVENRYYNHSEFVQGNPLDILGTFIKNNDFYSTNSDHTIMNNLSGNRRLFPVNQLNEIEKSDAYFKRKVDFFYDGKVLRPKDLEISPIRIDSLNEVSYLKNIEEFRKAAKKYLNATKEEINSLTSYLF